ncbi:MAG: YqgE/AlgH family protein [Brevirhabdus sp.]
MTELDPDSDLSGKLLIAMPSMGDPRFSRAVVYLCAHSEDGAMGLIINKPTPEVSANDLLDQLKITPKPDMPPIRVHFGGPVEHGRGFVLHSTDYDADGATLRVNDEFGMTATLDVLEALAGGNGPRESLLALGYSGWGPGQLESELQENGWLVSDATPRLVFSHDNHGKWEAALAALGIDPLLLSAEGGRA